MKMRFKFLFAATLLLLVAIRFWGLSDHSIWTDEQDSLMQSRHLAEIWPNRGNGVLYFLTLHFWRQLFGDSVYAIRSLSAAFGVLSAVLAAWIVFSVTRDRRSSLLCLLLTAFFPLLVWHARDARMYPMWGFAWLFAIYALLEIRQRGLNAVTLFQYGLAHVLALLTHSFHAVYMLPFLPLSLLLLGDKINRRQCFLLASPLVFIVAGFLTRLVALSESPGVYLLRYGFRDFDFRLLASLSEVFLYVNPALSQFGNQRNGILLFVALVALSIWLWNNDAIQQNVRRSMVFAFWVPFLFVHLMPVRDYARLFFPVALCFPILASLAVYSNQQIRTYRVAGVVLMCLVFWAKPLYKGRTEDMENWKAACASLSAFDVEVPVVSELNQPESPILQCGLKRPVWRHSPALPTSPKTSTEKIAAKLASRELFIVFRSPPWVAEKGSLVEQFDATLYNTQSTDYGPYLKRIVVQKKPTHPKTMQELTN